MNSDWINSIKYYFTRYDIVQMKNIAGDQFDLSNYEFVKKNASDILLSAQPSGKEDGLSRLGIPVMPINGKIWDTTRLKDFEEWIERGSPYGGDVPEPIVFSPDLPNFKKMSQELTGFSDLDDLHAQKILNRINKSKYSKNITEIIYLYSSNDIKSILIKKFEEARHAIILLWYTGAYFNAFGYPADSGSPENHEYREGLVWRAGQSHPMGFSTEGGYRKEGDYNAKGATYWEHEPEADGRYTGLGKS